MPYINYPNFSKVVLRTLHATPSTVVLRPSSSPHHSHHRFPDFDDVRSGTVYGPGQFEQQEYLTGTMVAGGGSAAYRAVGSAVVRRLTK
jgi:hypothetical protein